MSFPMKPHPSLLDIPPELRNIIYQYTLTAEKDLQRSASPAAASSDGQSSPSSSAPTSSLAAAAAISPAFNQLQFVNRQLHCETRDLELQYNFIKFTQDTEDHNTPLQKYEAYIAGLLPHKRSWVRSVTLVCHQFSYCLFHTVWRSQVVSFCEQHPHIRVKHRSPWFGGSYEVNGLTNPYTTVLKGLYLTYVLRGQVLTDLVTAGDLQNELMAFRTVDGWTDLRDRAPNFRICPAFTEIPRYWEELRECKKWGPKRYNVWMDYVKEWIENGI